MAAPYAGFDVTLVYGGETVGKAQNVDLDSSAGEIDVTTRSSNGWKEFIQGLKEWTVAIDQLWIPTDVGLDALRDRFFDGVALAVVLTDPDGNGFSGDAIVVGMRKGEPLDGACVLPFNLRGTGVLSIEGSS